MSSVALSDIRVVNADWALCDRLGQEWGDWASRHMHIDSGFSLVAFHGVRPVGLLTIRWRKLSGPLPTLREGYIDILHIIEGYRRKGIARKMVEMSLTRAEGAGALQVRAWSSADKAEAISLWETLGFALCPVTHRMWGPEIRGYFVAKRLDRLAAESE